MNQTGLVVVGPEPIESVFKYAENGLYLPAQSHYPEFQQAVVQVVTNQTNFKVEQVDYSYEQAKTVAQIIVAKKQQAQAQYQFNIQKNPNLLFKPKSAAWKISRLVPGLESYYIIEQCPTGETSCQSPLGGPLCSRVADAIVHLNDYHKWPREKIADWLDTLENIDLRVKKDAA